MITRPHVGQRLFISKATGVGIERRIPGIVTVTCALRAASWRALTLNGTDCLVGTVLEVKLVKRFPVLRDGNFSRKLYSTYG